MFSMIKAETKRMFKSRSFWVSLLIFSAVFSLCVLTQSSGQNANDFTVNDDAFQFGLYIAVDRMLTTLDSLVISFGATFAMLIMGIYLSSFSSQEYTSGYIKNIATIQNGRRNSCIAKGFSAVLTAIILISVSYLLSFLLGKSLILHFTLDSTMHIIQTAFSLTLLSISSYSMIICISIVLRSKVAGIIAAFMIASGMLLPLIEKILQIFNMTSLLEYTLSYQYAHLPAFDPAHADSMIIVSLFYFAIYNIITVLIVKKRDI